MQEHEKSIKSTQYPSVITYRGIVDFLGFHPEILVMFVMWWAQVDMIWILLQLYAVECILVVIRGVLQVIYFRLNCISGRRMRFLPSLANGQKSKTTMPIGNRTLT